MGFSLFFFLLCIVFFAIFILFLFDGNGLCFLGLAASVAFGFLAWIVYPSDTDFCKTNLPNTTKACLELVSNGTISGETISNYVNILDLMNDNPNYRTLIKQKFPKKEIKINTETIQEPTPTDLNNKSVDSRIKSSDSIFQQKMKDLDEKLKQKLSM